MPRKKSDEWVSGKEAAKILTENSGYTITANYVRLLAGRGDIGFRHKDGRTNEYRRCDLTGYTVVPKSKTKRAEVERNRNGAPTSTTESKEVSVPLVSTPT